MSLFSSLSLAASKAAKPPKPTNREITRDVLGDGKIKILNGQVTLYGDGTETLIRNSYMANADLYAIVRYIVNKALRAKYFNYKVVDEKALADYRMLKGPGSNEASLKEARKVRTKALVNTVNPGIDALLTKPNPSQSFKVLTEAAVAYKLLTGERFLQRIEGLSPVTRLFILPPTQMEVKTGDKYLEIESYLYRPTQSELTPQEIIFSKMFHPAMGGYGDELRGLSPLRVMALQIQKSNEGILSGLRQYQNAGPPGLLSLTDDEVPLSPEQSEQYEARLARRNGSNNRGRINITGMHAEWVALGLSPVDLDILQSGVFDLRAMCRAYGLDSKLFNDNAASTMNNQTDAGKAAIVNAVIPAVEDWGDDLNTMIEPFNVKGERNYIDADVTHFPELADDLDKVMDRMIKGPFKPNQILEAMHYEADPNPLMDEVWMPNDKTPLSQFSPDAPPVKNDNTY
ncbi:phage portal protein [Spirosoma foliorum]|uniref:Phage portal protein n=1 Tax=Spirosoma foliorum TaxID=2710596 RepID=A0A7G5H2G9_9BACT|nr:phage portal protein [Spirosoma foliorum]QMW05311.1 phage portal protein [Spirosoma foliorum]